MKYYFLHILGCIEGEVHGPFDSDEQRDEAAYLFHNESEQFDDEDDAVLWMDVDPTAHVQVKVGSYTGGFFAEDYKGG